jgi:hypothetical protein
MSNEVKSLNMKVNIIKPTCNVCVEDLNRSNRRDVICGFCQYSACRECYKHYILSVISDAHCMNCKKEWDYQTMISIFDRKFVDTVYKEHKENILVEKEKGLMVQTQPIVERIIDREKKMVKIALLRLEQNKILNQINMILDQDNEEVVRKKFIRKCTKEECKGFLSSQWKCGLCEFWTCPDCHDLLGINKSVEHVCDPDTLSTAKLLDSDTKSCPKCSVGIFKIEGCNQMFCTECHTAFDWKTGNIELGPIHNPHYFQYQREGNTNHIQRNPLEIRCGREIDRYFLHDLNIKFRKCQFLEENCDDPFKILKCRAVNILHIRHQELTRYTTNVVDDNQSLRIAYMRNFISEDYFKKQLQIRQKKDRIKREFHNILSMFITCQTEIFFRLDDELDNDISNRTGKKKESIISGTIREKIVGITLEMENLLSYTNKCMRTICILYKKKIINLTNEFLLITIQ